jgi:hypothetical protein
MRGRIGSWNSRRCAAFSYDLMARRLDHFRRRSGGRLGTYDRSLRKQDRRGKVGMCLLGGAFYSIDMLPPAWRTFSLFNPVVYLISGFRWSFYGAADVHVGVSLAATLGFFAL